MLIKKNQLSFKAEPTVKKGGLLLKKVFSNLIICSLISTALIALMTLVSELTGENSALFPELAALLIGSVIAAKQPYKAGTDRLFMLTSVCAAVGYVISAYVTFSYGIKLISAFILLCGILTISGSSMFMLISVGMTPVIMQIKSIIYPVSVILFTAAALLIKSLLCKHNIIKNNFCTPVRFDISSEVVRLILVLTIFMAASFAAGSTGASYLIAPPLITLLVESTFSDTTAGKKPALSFIIISLSGFIGASVRLIFCSMIGLPLTVSAAVIFMAVTFLIMMTRLPLISSGSAAVFALMIPSADLIRYPFELMVGTALFIITGFICKRYLCWSVSKKEKKTDEVLL